MTAAASAAPVVTTRDLCVRLGGRPILDKICLEIAPGNLVALIGPNGAGKTTLLRTLLGLLPVESGDFTLLGCDDLKTALPSIGYVPQRLALGDGLALSVREFLALRRRATRNWFWRRREALDRTWPAVAEELGVRPLLDKPVTSLSGGQLQRVLITFSLLDEPKLLFLDEPTEGVDAPGERTFYEIISDIHRARGLTVVLVSHDLSMVHRHASWVIALNGRVCCEGAPDDIIREDALREAYGLHVTSYHHHHHHGHSPIPSPSPIPSHDHPSEHDPATPHAH
ncbi:MAG: metal ABC transporter ATP-binding protein [Limisphaerales bacterium]